MERAAIEQLFAFTDYAWREYEQILRPLGDDLLIKSAPGSGWPALRDALVHINWAYVRWLWDPAGTSNLPPEQASSWDELGRYRLRVRARAQTYFEGLSDAELAAVREMNVDGQMVRYSPAEIVAHVLLHERLHHGDLNTLLYQLGMEVPIVEYRFSLGAQRT